MTLRNFKAVTINVSVSPLPSAESDAATKKGSKSYRIGWTRGRDGGVGSREEGTRPPPFDLKRWAAMSEARAKRGFTRTARDWQATCPSEQGTGIESIVETV